MTIKEFEVQIALGTLSLDDKLRLAGSERTSKKILIILSADDEHWAVKYRVARNPNTPKEVLKILSTDKYWSVRYWVACNSSTPTEVLIKLSIDKDSGIRRLAIRALH